MAIFVVYSPWCPSINTSCFFLHDLYTQFPYLHINSKLLPFEQPFFQGDVFCLFPLFQFLEIMLNKWVLHIDLPYLPFKTSFTLEDAP